MEVVFRLPDGELVTLDVSNQENRSSDRITFNTVSRSAGHDKWESGLVTISIEDFARPAAEEQVSAKITGSKQSAVYEEDDVSPEFLAKTRQFYETYLK